MREPDDLSADEEDLLTVLLVEQYLPEEARQYFTGTFLWQRELLLHRVRKAFRQAVATFQKEHRN